MHRSGRARQALPSLAFAVFAIVLASFAACVEAQLGRPDSISMRWTQLEIADAVVAGTSMPLGHRRRSSELELGFGAFSFGAVYQSTDDVAGPIQGEPEQGMMLTAGYDWLLAAKTRLEFSGRVGVFGETDPGQPLYATDTEMRANLVRFSPEGVGRIAGRRTHPSVYLGLAHNRYARTQVVVGAGVYWSGASVYFTEFRSLNGVANPMEPGDRAGEQFAALKNRGRTVNLSYELGAWKLEGRRNFAGDNGGNDLGISIGWSHRLGGERWLR